MSKLNTKTIVIIGVVVVILIAVVAKILVSKAEERNRGKNGPPKPTPGKPHCKALSFEARDGVKQYCAYIAGEADCTSSKDPIVGGRDCQWVTG